MITGTITVDTSDTSDFVAGSSYPITIDDSQVEVSVVTTTVASVTALPVEEVITQSDTPDSSSTPPDSIGGNDQPVEVVETA